MYGTCKNLTPEDCIKTAKHRITQIMPHDIPGTLMPKITAKFERDHSNVGSKRRWGMLKLAAFDE